MMVSFLVQLNVSCGRHKGWRLQVEELVVVVAEAAAVEAGVAQSRPLRHSSTTT